MDTKSRLQELLIKRNSYSSILEERIKRNDELKKELLLVQDSQMFVQAVAESIQSQLSSKIDNIVNLGIATCFPDYSFEMKYNPSRGKTEVLFIVKDGDNTIDPMNQNGGGFVDCLATMLRLAVFSISNVNNVLILDEPGKFISKSLRQRFGEVLKIVSERLNLQIIMVTHVDEFAENSDKKIHIVKSGGISNADNKLQSDTDSLVSGT